MGPGPKRAITASPLDLAALPAGGGERVAHLLDDDFEPVHSPADRRLRQLLCELEVGVRVLLHAGGVTWPTRPKAPRVRERSPHSDA